MEGLGFKSGFDEADQEALANAAHENKRTRANRGGLGFGGDDSQQGDGAAIQKGAADHYNARGQSKRRLDSKIDTLQQKNFNNWIKATLIARSPRVQTRCRALLTSPRIPCCSAIFAPPAQSCSLTRGCSQRREARVLDPRSCLRQGRRPAQVVKAADWALCRRRHRVQEHTGERARAWPGATPRCAGRARP
jgi:hypothetical protein